MPDVVNIESDVRSYKGKWHINVTTSSTSPEEAVRLPTCQKGNFETTHVSASKQASAAPCMVQEMCTPSHQQSMRASKTW
jgi:hypothetical protein